jgi:predicted deacylase
VKSDLDREIDRFRGEAALRDAIDLAPIGAYRGLGEILSELGQMRDHGARVSIAGHGHDGTPIPRVEIGPRDAKRRSLVVGGIHAMEWIGVETAIAILEEIIADRRARGERDDRQIVFFPVLNADGYRASELDLRAGRRTYRRANARGVDLNRNWPTHWRTTAAIPRMIPILGGAGAEPGSEPEVRVILDELGGASTRVPFDRAVSLHSFGRVLLVPWGGRFALPEHHRRHRALAAAVQARIESARYGIKAPSRVLPGVFVFGMELDHLHASGADAILVECSAGGISPLDPRTWIHPFRWYNPPDPAHHARDLARSLAPFLEGESVR